MSRGRNSPSRLHPPAQAAEFADGGVLVSIKPPPLPPMHRREERKSEGSSKIDGTSTETACDPSVIGASRADEPEHGDADRSEMATPTATIDDAWPADHDAFQPDATFIPADQDIQSIGAGRREAPWLKTLHRRRWSTPLAAAGAWCVTLAVTVFIVATAGLLILGPTKSVVFASDASRYLTTLTTSSSWADVIELDVWGAEPTGHGQGDAPASAVQVQKAAPVLLTKTVSTQIISPQPALASDAASGRSRLGLDQPQ